MDDEVHALARRQAGMLSRAQLRDLGLGKDRVRNQVAARRWQTHGPLVLSTTTGTLTFMQRVWLGVLHAGAGSAVGGLTATAWRGLRGWERPDITILVPQQADISPLTGVTFVRTRREIVQMLPRTPDHGPPVCLVEPAALLFGAYDHSSRTACGLLAALVQQRLTTADRLARWVDLMTPLRRARLFRSTLGAIDGGAQALSEIDVGRVCRRFGLPQPMRQVRRRGRDGRMRFTDCEWRLADGRRVVLEVDGAFHMDVAHWEEDIARQRSLVADGVLVVRCTAAELRHRPEAVARDLRAVGVGRAGHRAG